MVLNSTPIAKSSAHDDLLLVAYDAKAQQPQVFKDYKYVCDVIINGTRQARLKVFPRPDTYMGVFNINTVVRNFVQNQFNPTLGQIQAQVNGNDQFFVDVQCRIGEEYNNVLYVNVLEDSTRRYFNHTNGRRYANLTTLPAYNDKLLSNRPRTIELRLGDPFLFMPYYAATSGSFTVSINGDSQVKTINKVLDNAHLLNLSAVAINTEYPGAITGDYNVQIGSESIKFVSVCNAKYTPVHVVFLNKLGSYESFTFDLVSQKSYSFDRKTFGQLSYEITDAGSVSYGNGLVKREQVKTFNNRINEQIKCFSNGLSDEYHFWLQELMYSPEIYIYEQGYFIPVTIEESNYQPSQFLVNELQGVEVTFKYSDQQFSQFR